MSEEKEIKVAEDGASTTFIDFLESYHPSQRIMVSDLWAPNSKKEGPRATMNLPPLRLFCTHEECGGIRTFRRTIDPPSLYGPEDRKMTFVSYVCSDCRLTTKSFSLHVVFSGRASGFAYKYGEDPPFGVPIPTKVLRLFESEKELFLKGRQCENQGMGIAAFAYYRRVVEHQRSNIIQEIIKVSKVLGASDDIIKNLEEAREAFMFSASIEAIKPAIPQAILINGHNPLTLLHTALSRGLHNDNDADCLALAQNIRLVLSEMVGRLADLKKDDQELAKAVSNLMNPKTK